MWFGHARDEFLQHRGGARPVDLRDRGVGGELDDAEAGLRRLLGDAPAQLRDLLAARRRPRSSSRRTIARPSSTCSPRSCMSATVSSSCGIVAGGLGGQVLRRGREIAARDERPASCARELGVGRDRARAACRSVVERLVGAGPAPRARRRSSGTARRVVAHSRALREVAGGEVDVQQLLADLVVVRVQLAPLRAAPRSLRPAGPCRPARRRSP